MRKFLLFTFDGKSIPDGLGLIAVGEESEPGGSVTYRLFTDVTVELTAESTSALNSDYPEASLNYLT